MSELPPYLASEISSRMLAVDPMIREVFNGGDVTMSGADLEKLCAGVWLLGYGSACGDMADAPNGELPELAKWMSEAAA